MNALSVDVEGFAESNEESFSIPPSLCAPADRDREVSRNMRVVLDLLASTGTLATFFFLGRIARDDPGLVKETAAAGHEIGCHSEDHRRIFNLVPAEFAASVRAARLRLEDVSGSPVCGFRAPDFSITKASAWALDALQAAGFTYDSSIYPTSLHDVYGIADAPRGIHRTTNGIVEFPLSTVSIMGRAVPFGGGGYFRLYPLAFTEWLIRRENAAGRPCMFYIHPYEVGPAIPSIPGLSRLRRFRHYHNCSSGADRLGFMLRRVAFCPAVQVLSLIHI